MKRNKIINILERLIELSIYFLAATFTFSTALTEIAVSLIIISWFARKILARDSSFPRHLFLFVFLIFVGWNLLSFLNTGYIENSIRGLMKVIKYGLLLFSVIDILKSKQIQKRAAIVMIAWSFVVCLNGFVQNSLGFGLIRLRTIDSLDYLSRISSCFKHPNNFGAYLIIIISLLLSFICSKDIKWRLRAILLIGISLMFFFLFKTYSRSAWLTLPLVILFLGFIKSKRFFIGLIVLLLVVTLLLPQEAKTRITGLLDFKGGTNWERLRLWSGAVNMIKVHPVLGFGVNTYTENFPKYKPPDYWDSVYSHNCFLQMATEIGLVGLGLFLLFIFLALFYIIFSFKYFKKDWRQSLAQGLFTGLLGFLILSFVDTHLYSVKLAVMFYFLLGLAIALSDNARIEHS